MAFAVLNGKPLVNGKKTQRDQEERLRILRKAGIVFDPHAERERLGCRVVAIDDLINVATCLATAKRIVPGAAQPIAPRDANGLKMEIVA